MLDPADIVARILSFHPSAYAGGSPVVGTLMSRVVTAGVDSFSSVAWSALEQPTNKNMTQGAVVDGNETAMFQLLKQGQSTEPKTGDQLVIIGFTWNIRGVHANLQRYAFDCTCTKAEA